MQEELKKLKEQINEYDTISFDVFDTLLLRNVLSPTDLFELLNEEAEKNYGIKSFSKERIDAERIARIGKLNSETTIDEIYETLENKYNQNLSQLKKKELEIEEKFLIANPFMKEIFEYAKQKKKKVFAISDMYLTKEFIKKVLIQNGYVLDEIYVSSETKNVKGNGSLFEEVEKKEQLSKKNWLHIGDNHVSDVEQPQKLGINSYYYESVGKRSGFKNISGTIEESILKGIEQNIIYTKDCSNWEEFGIKCVAPIYYGFTNWIYQFTKHKDNIYFLARDGYAIKKVYDMFKEKCNKNINTYYLYCSRSAFQNPTLVDCGKEFALEILTRYNPTLNQKLEVNSILKTIGLNSNNYQKEYSNFDLSPETILDPSNIYRVKKFLSYIYSDIEKKLLEKEALVQKYLKEMDFEKYQDINIVDVGWAGSTQFSLTKLVSDKTITGYYFGTLKEMYDNVKYNSFGYAFDAENPKEIFKKIYENIMMYEFIMSAPHGTTKGFKKNKEKIKPILGDNSINEEYITIFQESAIKTCKEYLKYYDELKSVSSKVVISNYDEFLENRKYKDLVMFQKIVESVGYDGKNTTFVPTFCYEEIKKDLSTFYKEIDKSLWKKTFLIEGKNEEEYELIKKQLFSKKTKIKCFIKSINAKSLYRALRYPRTTLRKIKSILG